MSTMVESEVAKVETLAEQRDRELAEKTSEILTSLRAELDQNDKEDLEAEPVIMRVKGTIDKLSPFVSSANIRFTDGVSVFVLDKDTPVVQDGETGIVVVTMKPQEA